MAELAATMECLVCGRWWLSATSGNAANSTLCPGCSIDCANCGKPLTLTQMRGRKAKRAGAMPACSSACGIAIYEKGRADASV